VCVTQGQMGCCTGTWDATCALTAIFACMFSGGCN
jgi:hypothetical protein